MKKTREKEERKKITFSLLELWEAFLIGHDRWNNIHPCFKDYAVKATSKLPIEIETTEFETEQITEELSKWWEVVTYYTIRLALAPLIGSSYNFRTRKSDGEH